MKIEILYSEVANLFGDMANIKYLEKFLPKAKFIYTTLNEKPRFIKEKINLVYMGPMSENSQELVIKTLSNYKKEEIKNEIPIEEKSTNKDDNKDEEKEPLDQPKLLLRGKPRKILNC